MKKLKHKVLQDWINAVKTNTVKGKVTQIFYNKK
jgi:hypothetical protein